MSLFYRPLLSMLCTYIKWSLNGQIVIIHEFQLSEILKRADFYRDVQIINPSIKPSRTACTDIDSV